MNRLDQILQANIRRFSGPCIYLDCGKGWANLIEQFFFELDSLDPKEKIKIAQIKEKYGLLSIGIWVLEEETWKDFYELEFKYRLKSKSICEICGHLGKLRSFGALLKTTCETCKPIQARST
jgi:hypothetical protein